MRRVRVLKRLERWEEALAAYEEMIRLEPESFLVPSLLEGQAEVLMHVGRAEEALEVYDRVLGDLRSEKDLASLSISGKVRLAGLYVKKGKILERLQRCAEAVTMYEEAEALDPRLSVQHIPLLSLRVEQEAVRSDGARGSTLDNALGTLRRWWRAFTTRWQHFRKQPPNDTDRFE